MLKKLGLINLNVLLDMGWRDAPTSIHSRGLHDFQRLIQFNREPSADELDITRTLLEEDDNCPGWTGVRYKTYDRERYVYLFLTTYDSSD